MMKLISVVDADGRGVVVEHPDRSREVLRGVLVTKYVEPNFNTRGPGEVTLRFDVADPLVAVKAQCASPVENGAPAPADPLKHAARAHAHAVEAVKFHDDRVSVLRDVLRDAQSAQRAAMARVEQTEIELKEVALAGG